MELTITHHDGYVLAATQGPLDESIRASFKEQLHPLVRTEGTRLVLDLASSPRVNSAGLGLLVALVSDANARGSRVAICNLTPFVSGVISVTKLDKYFDIFPDVNSAVSKIAATN